MAPARIVVEEVSDELAYATHSPVRNGDACGRRRAQSSARAARTVQCGRGIRRCSPLDGMGHARGAAHRRRQRDLRPAGRTGEPRGQRFAGAGAGDGATRGCAALRFAGLCRYLLRGHQDRRRASSPQHPATPARLPLHAERQSCADSRGGSRPVAAARAGATGALVSAARRARQS